MKKILCVLMLGISCLAVTSCSKKDGETTVIEKSNDVGTIIHSGVSDPVATIGKNGDFYINLSTGALFGPKKADIWGSGLILSGDAGKDGANGKDGNMIVHGKGAPLPTTGNIGDFYFDTENVSIYGAKTSLGWGTPINLKPQQDSGIRILIKEAPGFKAITDEKGALIINNSADFVNKIKIGDIRSYYNDGAVIVQVKVNDSGWNFSGYWSTDTPDYSYGVEFSSENGTSYDGDYFTFSTNAYYFRDKSGIKDEKVLLQRVQAAIDKSKIIYKFILIPAANVDKIAKRHPGENIDERFLNRYLSLAN